MNQKQPDRSYRQQMLWGGGRGGSLDPFPTPIINMNICSVNSNSLAPDKFLSVLIPYVVWLNAWTPNYKVKNAAKGKG